MFHEDHLTPPWVPDPKPSPGPWSISTGRRNTKTLIIDIEGHPIASVWFLDNMLANARLMALAPTLQFFLYEFKVAVLRYEGPDAYVARGRALMDFAEKLAMKLEGR